MSNQHVRHLANIVRDDEAIEAQVAEKVRQAVREGDVTLGVELDRVLENHEDAFGLSDRNALAQSLTFQTRARRMVGLAMEQVEKLSDKELRATHKQHRTGVTDWIDGTLTRDSDGFSDVVAIVVTCGRDPAYGLLYSLVLDATADRAAQILEQAIVDEANTERGVEWRKRMKSRLQPSRSS